MSEDFNQDERKTYRRQQRLDLIERLQEENAYDLSERLESCGSLFPMTCTNCGTTTEAETHCKARYCPECRPIVTAERVARWGAAIDRMRWPLFITLTIPNSTDPETLTTLKKSWQKFRRRKLIRDRVKGGVATYEITNCGNGWHPHLHAIADCRWLSLYVKEPHPRDSAAVVKQKCEMAATELSVLWGSQIGQEAGIVKATRLPPGDSRFYALKYAAKASDLLETKDPIAPMLRVLRATRTLAGWGNCFPLPSPDTEGEPECACGKCGATRTLLPSEVLHYLCRTDRATDNRSSYFTAPLR